MNRILRKYTERPHARTGLHVWPFSAITKLTKRGTSVVKRLGSLKRPTRSKLNEIARDIEDIVADAKKLGKLIEETLRDFRAISDK